MSNYTKPGLSKKVTLIFNVSEDGKIALSTNEGDMPNAKRLDWSQESQENVKIKSLISLPIMSLERDGELHLCIPCGNQCCRI
jgi:hypothetical protein